MCAGFSRTGTPADPALLSSRPAHRSGLAESRTGFRTGSLYGCLEAKEYGLVDEVLGNTDHVVSVRDGVVNVPSLNGHVPKDEAKDKA